MKQTTPPNPRHPTRQARAALRQAARTAATSTIEPGQHPMTYNGTALQRKAARLWRDTDQDTLDHLGFGGNA